jgi:hypothetical protein
VSWLRGLPGYNGTSALLKSTWHQSLQQWRHLRWASDPFFEREPWGNVPRQNRLEKNKKSYKGRTYSWPN